MEGGLVMFVIPNLLNAEQLSEIKAELRDAEWEDGILTTGADLKNIKYNKQVTTKGVIAKVEKVLLESHFFRNLLLIKGFCRVMIVKYETEMHYGTHVDSWIQSGKRADFSFTLFLSDKNDYKGGELVIDERGKETRIKLDAGGIVMYPSTILHRVNNVTEGTRLVAVGWVTSYVRNEEYRNVLYNLAQTIAEISEKDGYSMPYMKLTQIYNNLMRLWAE
jgi:PKHD-type hydroxylase